MNFTIQYSTQVVSFLFNRTISKVNKKHSIKFEYEI